MRDPFLQSDAPSSLEDRRRGRRVALVVGSGGADHALVAILAEGGLPISPGPLLAGESIEAGGRSPDAVVLAADMTQPAGLATLRRLRRGLPATRIVVVAGDDATGGLARQALNAGADAYIPYREARRSLAFAVHAVMAGLVCAPRQARRLVAKPTFSQREKDVLGLLVAGLTNRQIAARLFLAESTVKTHLASAFAKLGVRSRKDAIALLLEPGEHLAQTALPLRRPGEEAGR